jgi:hypothetical protein
VGNPHIDMIRGWRPHISVTFPVIVDMGKGNSPHIALCGENLLMWGGKSYDLGKRRNPCKVDIVGGIKIFEIDKYS